MKRTKQERHNAIGKLNDNKDRLPKNNRYGNSNEKIIEAMKDVIKNQRSDDYILKKYTVLDKHGQENENLQEIRQNAMNAKAYMDFECTLEDILIG